MRINYSYFSNGYKDPSILDYLKYWFIEEDRSGLPSDDILNQTLPVLKPQFDLNSKLSATWLGHSTLFVHMDSISFITDPSLNLSYQFKRFIGFSLVSSRLSD
jgi:hypothetical protein